MRDAGAACLAIVAFICTVTLIIAVKIGVVVAIIWAAFAGFKYFFPGVL